MKNMKKIICLLLALTVCLSLLGGCGKSDSDEKNNDSEADYEAKEYALTDAAVTKDETVYVNLNADGSLKKVNVSDHMHVGEPQVRIRDASDLDDITDVKTFIEPVWQDKQLYWDMESTDLYYSGTSDKETPVNIDITYYLDGEEISPNKLEGKSGNVTIDINVTNTLTKSVNVSGGTYSICCPIITAGGMILPEDSFENLTVTNGIVLGDGAHQLVLMLGVPGMDESLGISSLGLPLISNEFCRTHYTVSADVTDFTMGNIMFAAVPFSSVGALSNEDISENMAGVKQALSDIESVMNALSSQGVEDIVQMLYGDISQAQELINAVADAADLYESNKALLETMSKYITDENLNTLNTLIQDMEKLDMSQLEGLSNIALFRQVNELLSTLHLGLSSFAAFTNDALNALPLLESIEADMNSAQVQEAIQNLPQTISKLRQLMNVLNESRQLMDDLAALAESDYTQEIMTILETADKYAGMDNISQAQAEHLAGRMKEWLAFGQEYDIFTDKYAGTESTVIFIYKTEAI